MVEPSTLRDLQSMARAEQVPVSQLVREFLRGRLEAIEATAIRQEDVTAEVHKHLQANAHLYGLQPYEPEGGAR